MRDKGWDMHMSPIGEKTKGAGVGVLVRQPIKATPMKLKTKNGYRLRGMATHPDFRRKSAATKLMEESFIFLKQKECDILWCNARLIAVKFYKSLGFKIIGEIFDIPKIGPHYKMYKSIINQ